MKNKFYQKIILVFSLFILLFSATPAMAVNCICYEKMLSVGTYESEEKCLSEHPTLPGAYPTYCVKVDTTPTTSPIIQDVQKAAAAKEAATTKDIQFTPQIGIPGSEFEQGVGVAIGGTVTKNGSKTLVANLISRYVNSLYSWGLSVVGIFAVLMLMAGGILWITSGGDTARIESAKKMITNIFLGSILLLGAWFLLNTINPNLVKPANIEITTISKEDVQQELVCCSNTQGEVITRIKIEEGKKIALEGDLEGKEVRCGGTSTECDNSKGERCLPTKEGGHSCMIDNWCCECKTGLVFNSCKMNVTYQDCVDWCGNFTGRVAGWKTNFYNTNTYTCIEKECKK